MFPSPINRSSLLPLNGFGVISASKAIPFISPFLLFVSHKLRNLARPIHDDDKEFQTNFTFQRRLRRIQIMFQRRRRKPVRGQNQHTQELKTLDRRNSVTELG